MPVKHRPGDGSTDGGKATVDLRGGDAPPAMMLGDAVTYRGKPHVVRGLQPMSVPERRAQVEDLESGRRVWVPMNDLTPTSRTG